MLSIVCEYGDTLMTIIDNQMLWRQFGAAIDMLDAALRDCPDALWEQQLWEDQPGAAGVSVLVGRAAVCGAAAV